MANTTIPSELIADGAITSAKLDTNIAVGGTLGVTGATTMTGLTVSESNNGDPVLGHFINANAGTATEATVYITNSSTVSDGLFLETTGSSFTTVGGFVQDGGVIGTGAGASGGLSIMTRANADMRFYTNGHTNERLRIDASGNVGIGDTNPRTQTTIVGAGQTTADITDAGNQGGTLTLGQNSDAFNSGGALLFAALNDGGAYTPQVAIKSLLQNGGGQGVGHLAFSMRAATGDTALAERLRILNGGGITFNGETAAANALDGYEEGTFTPTVTTTSGTLTLRTDYDLLGYTKIGRVVTITGMIVIGSISSPSGTLVIGDLPFEMFQDSDAASQTRPSIHLYAGGSGAPNAGYYSAFINFVEGTRAGVLIITYNSTYDSTCADWMSVGSDLFINFSYHTA